MTTNLANVIDVDLHAVSELTENDLKEPGLSLGHRHVLPEIVGGSSRTTRAPSKIFTNI